VPLSQPYGKILTPLLILLDVPVELSDFTILRGKLERWWKPFGGLRYRYLQVLGCDDVEWIYQAQDWDH
jgi:hypothetical protein